MIWPMHSFVLSLARRPERLLAFRQRWPPGIPPPEACPAVDGRATGTPAGYRETPGAWGCLRTHLRLLEDQLTAGWEAMAVFEDDCVFAPNFHEALTAFLAAVPDDWEQLYLGGQHLQPPEQAGPVLRCRNCNRTHAMVWRLAGARKAYLHLVDGQHRQKAHVDHWLGELHESGALRAYAPRRWLCGQAAGESDIKRSNPQRREEWWPWN